MLLKGTYFGCCFPTHPIHSSMVNLAPQHIILLCWWTVFFCKGLDFTYWCKVLQTRKEEGTGAKESFLLESSLPISFTLAASGGRYPRHPTMLTVTRFAPIPRLTFKYLKIEKVKYQFYSNARNTMDKNFVVVLLLVFVVRCFFYIFGPAGLKQISRFKNSGGKLKYLIFKV